MDGRPWQVLFACGGTGGHLFPALATAEALLRQAPETQIAIAGGGRPAERRIVAAAGYRYVRFASAPLPRGPTRLLRIPGFAWNNWRGYRQARALIQRQPIDLVVGTGGFASAPACYAALRLGRPLVLLEQNAVLGRVNRWLAPRAALLAAAFEESLAALPDKHRGEAVGVPVRSAFLPVPSERTEDATAAAAPRLLVMGGSRGARSMNRVVPAALARLRPLSVGWEIVHQAGADDVESVARTYQAADIPARVEAFIDDLPSLLKSNTLAICRAGGSTLAELAVCGTPAILIPYPYATDDHQRKNATIFERSGAAEIFDPGPIVDDGQEQAAVESLVARLAPLLDMGEASRRRLSAMSQAMRQLAKPQAAEEVARRLLEVLRDHCSGRSPRPM